MHIYNPTACVTQVWMIPVCQGHLECCLSAFPRINCERHCSLLYTLMDRVRFYRADKLRAISEGFINGC